MVITVAVATTTCVHLDDLRSPAASECLLPPGGRRAVQARLTEPEWFRRAVQARLTEPEWFRRPAVLLWQQENKTSLGLRNQGGIHQNVVLSFERTPTLVELWHCVA